MKHVLMTYTKYIFFIQVQNGLSVIEEKLNPGTVVKDKLHVFYSQTSNFYLYFIGDLRTEQV